MPFLYPLSGPLRLSPAPLLGAKIGNEHEDKHHIPRVGVGEGSDCRHRIARDCREGQLQPSRDPSSLEVAERLPEIRATFVDFTKTDQPRKISVAVVDGDHKTALE